MDGAAVVGAQHGQPGDDVPVGVLGAVLGLCRVKDERKAGRCLKGQGGFGMGGGCELGAGRDALGLAVYRGSVHTRTVCGGSGR